MRETANPFERGRLARVVSKSLSRNANWREMSAARIEEALKSLPALEFVHAAELIEARNRFFKRTIMLCETQVSKQIDRGTQQLLYRRQFLLGPRYGESLPTWKRTPIRANLLLTTHPDLGIHKLAKGNKSLTLLGFLLDPDDPDAGDARILEQLFGPLCEDEAGSKRLECVDRLGGRWVLIVDDGTNVEVFTDFFGMRQVFYTVPEAGMSPWCASHLGLLRTVLDLPFDLEAQDYLEAMKEQGRTEYWWPGTSTLCKGVKCLTPNHALNLITSESRRFWPREALASTSLRRAVSEGGRLLSGLMKAAMNRCPLMVLMSSGLDSRLLLASARERRKSLTTVTFIVDGITPDSADVTVPSRLLPSLGVAHQVLDCTQPMDTEFAQLYLSNTTASHEAYGKIAYAMFQSGLTSFLRVTGAGGEAFRPEYVEFTPRSLASAYQLIDHPFVLKELATWVESFSDALGWQPEDIFYLEQRLGRWLSEGQTEWDIAQDSFTPFDCRALVELLMGVQKDYLRGPGYELVYSLIRNLWSDVLREPVNPHKEVPACPHTWKQALRHAMVKAHILDYILPVWRAFDRNHGGNLEPANRVHASRVLVG
jgi:hypothetical protein